MPYDINEWKYAKYVCLNTTLDTRSRIFLKLNWIYQDQQNWYKLYTGCGGKFQSPIDLPVSGLVKVHGQRPLIFGNYAEVPLTMTMFFDGNRIIVHGKWHKNNMPLIFGGAAHSRRYIFYCLSMHWPTEHKIGGLSYPLELQILHISAEYASFEDAMKGSNNDPMAFLCVSVIFRYEQHTHPPLKNLLKAGIRSRASNVSLNPIPLSHISPPFHNYVAYHGSLPVPPCTESVLWIVRSKALPIKREFLEAVNVALSIQGETEKLLGRSVQSLNDRKVYLFNL
ncbi:carbonic anhydrase 6-like [Hyposmocoma kahamanoa]|uniref:carbonic anhydrase 6-like n=1 Tax=Hyposmocoma kahamanoa TaxID=1477025 RepID=UPI000E6D6995|nr:carbonic anhydrase 6-like [Hyposmocoma kahamanoa]